jgi:prepilin-type N-terminal cleavage/methylation domain-containing protein
MIRHIREMQARRRGEELDFEAGFTLIELLIVIVVLGILAATVVFALSSVTSSSATAACNTDAKSYQVAVSAYQNSTSNPTNGSPANTNALVPAYLHAAANNTAYAIAISGDTGTPATGVKNWSGTPAVPTTTGGIVYVLDKEDTTPAWVAYDSQTATNGCNSSNL